jgi:hypothetical protein
MAQLWPGDLRRPGDENEHERSKLHPEDKRPNNLPWRQPPLERGLFERGHVGRMQEQSVGDPQGI